jgi:hypothetical protein
MNRKHRDTLDRIFARQVPAHLAWRDVESLFRALGATITERAGSRVVISLNGVRALFHRPHPGPTTDKGAVRAIRSFLEQAGVRP